MPREHHRSHLLQRRGGPEIPPLEIRHAFPEPYAEPEADAGIATIVSVVYVTASPTFTGAIAGYSTQSIQLGVPIQLAGSSSILSSPAESITLTASQSGSIRSRPPKPSRPIQQPTPSLATTSSSPATQTSSLFYPTAAAVATSAASSTSIPSSNASSSQGMSGGAKAGLGLGVLLAIALILGVVLLFYRRKKKSIAHQRLQDEKGSDPNHQGSQMTAPVPSVTAASDSSSVMTARTNLAAPRLSLRPLTIFDPELGGDRRSAVRSYLVGLTPGSQQAVHPSRSETPVLSAGMGNNADDSANPFSDHAQESPPQASPLENSQLNPLDNDPTELDSHTIPLAASATALPTAPAPLAVTLTPLKAPSAAESPTPLAAPAPMAPPAATAPAAVAKSSNVHRVHLDFKPSMDDELQLTAGQLVRLLHEYDDGWGLCTYLDRSEQGVAPRSCLSKYPVKPRPINKPPGPSSGSLPLAHGPPLGPHPGRTPRSQLQLESPVLRTADFTSQRPTPPADCASSNLSAQVLGLRKPVGQSIPNRKPVGQAH